MKHLSTVVALAIGLAVACTVRVPAQQFAEHAPLSTPRYFAGTVLLQDGRILIAGGRSSSDTYEFTCEVFDPLSNTTVVTAPMWTPRYLPSCVLLRDGRVLVTGGRNVNGTLADCELYNPLTNSWTRTRSMNRARALHTITLLYDGRVLVTGGLHNQSLRNVEIFDPATEVWTEAAPFPEHGRNSHCAVLLPDSSVLVTDGYSTSAGVSGQCYIFYPSTNSWATTAGMLQGSGDHTLTLLPNGKILLAGGWPVSLSRCEIYDPATGRWSKSPAMHHQRTIATTTLLPNGAVLTAGGYDSRGSDQSEFSIASCELFHPATEQWTELPSLPRRMEGHGAVVSPTGAVVFTGGGRKDTTYAWNPKVIFPNILSLSLTQTTIGETGIMKSRHYGHTATLLSTGAVLLAGGGTDCSAASVTDFCSVFLPTSALWTQAPNLRHPRMFHTATLLPDGTVLVVGGRGIQQNTPQALASAERYNAITGVWMQVPPASTERFHHTATLLADGRVLVTGGAQGSEPEYITWETVNSAEVYDDQSNTWQTLPAMAERRFGHTATLLPNGKVLVTGGRSSVSGILASTEVYDPATNTWQPMAPMQQARLFHTATLLPDGTVLVTGGLYGETTAERYDYRTNTWRIAGEPSEGISEHTAILLPTGDVLVAGGKPTETMATTSPLQIYSPVLNAWRTVGRLPVALAAPRASLLPDNSILLSGGYLPSSCQGSPIGFTVGHTTGYRAEDRPVLHEVEHLSTGADYDILSITGLSFQGRSGSEGSSGNYYTSASNYPIVEIRRIGGNGNDHDFVQYLPFHTAGALWSNTSTAVRIFNRASIGHNLPAGLYRLSVIANGIPSLPVFLSVSPAGITVGDHAVSVAEAPPSPGDTGLHVAIYPNPATDRLTVEGTALRADDKVAVELSTLLGVPVVTATVAATPQYRCDLSTTSLPQGTYTLRIRCNGLVQSSLVHIVR